MHREGGHEMSEDLALLRQNLCDLHAALVAADLVGWTSGNISARMPGENLMIIKQSGVGYPELTADSMVVCDLDGHAVEDTTVNSKGYRPSSDTATHAYVYRRRSSDWTSQTCHIPCTDRMMLYSPSPRRRAAE
jgi:L-ribulose-5-phosphate 4-epimerase